MLAEGAAKAAEQGAHGGGHEESTGEVLIHHVTDSDVWHFFKDIELHLPEIHLFGIDFSISLHVIMMWIAAVLVFLLFRRMAVSMQKQGSLVARGPFALLEMMVLFVRDEIAYATMGEKVGRRMTPLLLTFFFFILFCNLLGLVPFMSTATGNINVTAALALVTFLVIQAQGMKENGVLGYWKSLVPSGVPVFLVPIMIPVEFLGLFTKPFALCMRLFANMIAGHVVILSLIMLIFTFGSLFIAPISVGFALFIYLLEILVAFIQAYIFTMLSALFIGMAAHPEH
ncbi:MAG: F0F1 ATP synthase subunit A [Candidatus Marinimicrobia bacterium]|nr:F0F1 ATP synthase subunit A [Candidatus Neomarinimicrobiota bacterium]MCF7829891.1 F0F1 ATP synthase subunit A [Candidatus Neomarinimicrobiota bacterium]MCF7879146.1 F0F1 ATP synthase subunit A [Candidatus Neomarinimicrobiota bacterium]